MISNNHKKSGCEFSEELVSYLYGEVGPAEATAVAAHLETCPICADELNAFSGVRFSIGDWKSGDFEVLESPLIEIPYGPAETAVRVPAGKGSRLSALRGFFSLSPRAWSLATASLAIFAVCVGIVIFALNSVETADLAVDKKNVNPGVAPTAEKSPERSSVEPKPNDSLRKAVKPAGDYRSPRPEAATAPDKKNHRVVTAASDARSAPKPENPKSPKSIKASRAGRNSTEIPSQIFEEEEEDRTLRLADLFDEIDTEK